MKITKETLRRLVKEELDNVISESPVPSEESLKDKMSAVMKRADLSIDDKMKELARLIDEDPIASAEIQAKKASQDAKPNPWMTSGLNDEEELSKDDKIRQALQRKLEK